MTVGISPKFKLALVVMLGVAAPVMTALAAIWPDVFTAPVIAAITAVVTAVAGLFGVYRGEPGDVVVEQGPASDDMLSPAAVRQMPEA